MMEHFIDAIGYLRDLQETVRLTSLTMLDQLPTDDAILDQKFYELHEDLGKAIEDLDMIKDIIRYRGKK